MNGMTLRRLVATKNHILSYGYQTCSPEDDQFVWDNTCDSLTEIMQAINPNSKEWYCIMENFGWQKINGHGYFHVETGQQLLHKVLPNTVNSFRIHLLGTRKKGYTIEIQNTHHDSPIMGSERYYISIARKGQSS